MLFVIIENNTFVHNLAKMFHIILFSFFKQQKHTEIILRYCQLIDWLTETKAIMKHVKFKQTNLMFPEDS